MKAIDVTPQPVPEHPDLTAAHTGFSPGKNGFHNGCATDEEIDIDETDDAVIKTSAKNKTVVSAENYKLTNGGLPFRSEQKKNLIASLGGTNEYPFLNGNNGSKYESSRVNHVVTRLTEDRPVVTNGISNILSNGELSKNTEVRLQNGDCKTVSIADDTKRPAHTEVRLQNGDCKTVSIADDPKRPASLSLINDTGKKLIMGRKSEEENVSSGAVFLLTNGGISDPKDAKNEESSHSETKSTSEEQLLTNVGKLAFEFEDDPATAQFDKTVAGVKEQTFSRLQEELKKAHQELRLRDEEVSRLSRIREEVEAELEELTASLFQEAHNMVREANIRQALAEKALKESQMQVEVLTAEVSALKTLVLTSTPSRPNPHLHPQIDLRGNRSKDDTTLSGVGLFTKKHRRSPSHFNLKYGRENSPPESPVKEQRTSLPDPLITDTKDGCEVDPVVHREFMAWKQNPKFDKSDPFITRIYCEDIDLCLNFTDKELTEKVRSAVEAGNIFIEAVSDKSKTVFPKKCALLEAPRQCHYRMKLGDQEQWHCISQICRNRIIAVCDFLNYLRYIERGLVKSSVHDVYWEMVRLRKEMTLARLGLPLSA